MWQALAVLCLCAVPFNEERAQELVDQLREPKFLVREAAHKELEQMSYPLVVFMSGYLKDKDAEVRHRADRIIQNCYPNSYAPIWYLPRPIKTKDIVSQKYEEAKSYLHKHFDIEIKSEDQLNEGVGNLASYLYFKDQIMQGKLTKQDAEKIIRTMRGIEWKLNVYCAEHWMEGPIMFLPFDIPKEIDE